MALDNRDKSIIAQVAFKAAAEHVRGLDLETETGASTFATVFALYANELFGVVNQLTGASAAVNGGGGGQPSAEYTQAAAENAVRDAFPGTATEPANGGGVTVKGKQHGPLPQWLVDQAAAKGVTEVWDNRDRLPQSPKSPHFKATNADIPFWPPKGR